MISSHSTIIHIITGLEVGGAERALHTLLTNGLEGPFRNQVISLMGPGYYGPLLEAAGIPVACLHMRPGHPSPWALLKLRKALATTTPGIIQGWMPHGNFVAFIARWLMYPHAALSWNIRITLESEIDQSWLTRLLTRFNAARTPTLQSLIYNSARSRFQHELLGYDDSQAHVLPNGFDVETWRPHAVDRIALRQEWGIAEADRVIGFVGRGHHEKDIPNLFAAVKQLSLLHPEAVLVGVGRDLDRFTPQPRRFIPLGQRTDVPRIMRGFDLLCLSSRAEGFPNVLGEAMASGVPCVTTDVGDARLIVGDTGWVAPPRDSEALAQALRQAFETPPDELRRRGEAARFRIQQDFAIAKVVDCYIDLYSRLGTEAVRCVV